MPATTSFSGAAAVIVCTRSSGRAVQRIERKCASSTRRGTQRIAGSDFSNGSNR